MTLEEKQKFIFDHVSTIRGRFVPYDLERNNIPFDYFRFDDIDKTIVFIKYIEENFKECFLTVKSGFISFKVFHILVVAESKEILNLIRITT